MVIQVDKRLTPWRGEIPAPHCSCAECRVKTIRCPEGASISPRSNPFDDPVLGDCHFAKQCPGKSSRMWFLGRSRGCHRSRNRPPGPYLVGVSTSVLCASVRHTSANSPSDAAYVGGTRRRRMAAGDGRRRSDPSPAHKRSTGTQRLRGKRKGGRLAAVLPPRVIQRHCLPCSPEPLPCSSQPIPA